MRTAPIRVLIVTQNFPQKQIQWSGEFLIRLARLLAHHEIECEFVVPRAWAPWPLTRLTRWQKFGSDNPLLHFENLPARLVHYLRPPGASFFLYEGRSMLGPVLRLAKRWHARQPFDLVLGVQMNGEGAVAAALGRRLGVPSAAMAIGTDIMVLPELVPGLVSKLSETLRNLDLPIAVSEALGHRLEQIGGCRRRPFLLRLPRDVEAFRPAADRDRIRKELGIAEDDVVGIYVGRLEAAKGMDELCIAAGTLLVRHPRFRLFCLGEGVYRDRLGRLGEGRACAVVAPGHVAPADVPRFLQAADFMILPSHSEGLPQVIIEAMNCGLPVVATDVGGTKEAVLDGETGVLVPARDASALGTAIEKLIEDPETRTRMGSRGLEFSRSEFDPIEHTARFAHEIRATVAAARLRR